MSCSALYTGGGADRDSSGELSSIVNPGIMMISDHTTTTSPTAKTASMPCINPNYNPDSMLDDVDDMVADDRNLVGGLKPRSPHDAVVKLDMDLIEMVISRPEYSSITQNLR
jgi:hypothetical protein